MLFRAVPCCKVCLYIGVCSTPSMPSVLCFFDADVLPLTHDYVECPSMKNRPTMTHTHWLYTGVFGVIAPAIARCAFATTVTGACVALLALALPAPAWHRPARWLRVREDQREGEPRRPCYRGPVFFVRLCDPRGCEASVFH